MTRYFAISDPNVIANTAINETGELGMCETLAKELQEAAVLHEPGTILNVYEVTFKKLKTVQVIESVKKCKEIKVEVKK